MSDESGRRRSSYFCARPLAVGVAGKRILLAEDDYFIVTEMAHTFKSLGALLIGPFATVAGILEYLDAGRPLDGAVLDINLRGEMAFDVADRLASRRVPFVFTSGYSDNMIPGRFASVARCEKPVDAAKVASALFG